MEKLNLHCRIRFLIDILDVLIVKKYLQRTGILESAKYKTLTTIFLKSNKKI